MLDERESSLIRPSPAIFKISVIPSDFKIFQLLPHKNNLSSSNNGMNIISPLSFAARVAPSYSHAAPLLSYHQFYTLKIHQTKQLQTEPNSPPSPQLATLSKMPRTGNQNKDSNIRSYNMTGLTARQAIPFQSLSFTMRPNFRRDAPPRPTIIPKNNYRTHC